MNIVKRIYRILPQLFLCFFCTVPVIAAATDLIGPKGNSWAISGSNSILATAAKNHRAPDLNDPAQDFALVYSRVPRVSGKTSITHHQNGDTVTIMYPDVWDRLPDTNKLLGGFNAPGQLVYFHNGEEEIIFDCIDAHEDWHCLPFDAAVSPDGLTIAFSVYMADKLVNPRSNGYILPQSQQPRVGSGARIYTYDIQTRTLTPWPHEAGNYDISPAWLPDGRIVFASNRGAYGPPWAGVRMPTRHDPRPRLYLADGDGGNPVDISPHEMGGAIHPYVLTNGRIIYSSHWLSHNLAYFKTNSHVQGMATLFNSWAVGQIDQEGGDTTTLLGGHRNHFKYPDGTITDLKALHFMGQRSNGDICVTNYYRGNNLGLGDVLCWEPEPPGQEGPAPDFLPSTLYSVANWSTSRDSASKKIAGAYSGKLGWPEESPDNQLIVTAGLGYCSQSRNSLVKNQAEIDDQPPGVEKKGCDTGIFKTTVIPSMSVSDLVPIVDSPDWHEFSARLVRARSIAKVRLRESESGLCEIINTGADRTDAHSNTSYAFNNNYFSMANNGAEIAGLGHGKMVAIRFYTLTPNPFPGHPRDASYSSIGNPTYLLGDVPLLADGSFRVALPCETPFIMAGIDRVGRVLKRDQLPQSLRQGEERVCTGCHLHGKAGRSYKKSLAATSEALVLNKASRVPNYTDDILPIFNARCTSCHEPGAEGPGSSLYDYQDLVWDFTQEKIMPKLRVPTDAGFGLQRPYTSKYVNTMFSRESLLYWKAINRRTDGRTDETFDTDIDFGANHPSDITDEEIRLLALWLDSGAPEKKGRGSKKR